MALSQAAMDELRRELQTIEIERKRLDFRANAIRQVLGEQPPDQPNLLGVATVNIHGWTARPDTFKGCVKQVLEQNPGLKVPEVTRTLRRLGWLPQGSTDIGHRVYNEIWRMKDRGEVRRNDDGGYELV